MDIYEQLDEILEILKDSGTANYIAMFSVCIAAVALIVNVVANRRNRKQYIESLRPLLSFEFYEANGILLLSIKNTGKTEAKSIRIDILQLRNNGDENRSDLDDLFKAEFMLYPMEEVQGTIAIYGGNVVDQCSPVLDVKVAYLNGNDNKRSEYSRTITFKRTIHERNAFTKIEDSIESISYSNNRLVNYMEGRTLFRHDKRNVLPHNSLYEDMKDAFNNIERRESTDKK